MKRRHFIRVAATSLVLPVVLKSQPILAFSSFSQRRDYVFFDERFENARRIAAAWSASSYLNAVQSDVTSTWKNGLDRMTREYPLTLRGVTTDSFRFCLQVLIGEHADVDVQASRMDRNLFLWTMRTTPKSNY